jgi:hypothetical protein
MELHVGIIQKVTYRLDIEQQHRSQARLSHASALVSAPRSNLYCSNLYCF